MSDVIEQPKRKQGRPPGSKNKSSILKVDEVMSDMKLHPVREALKLLPQLDAKDQVKFWLELHSYVEAKPKDSETQAMADNYRQLVANLGPERVEALANGLVVDSMELRMLNKLAKADPALYKQLLLDEGDK
jgi:hypothetical protein